MKDDLNAKYTDLENEINFIFKNCKVKIISDLNFNYDLSVLDSKKELELKGIDKNALINCLDWIKESDKRITNEIINKNIEERGY